MRWGLEALPVSRVKKQNPPPSSSSRHNLPSSLIIKTTNGSLPKPFVSASTAPVETREPQHQLLRSKRWGSATHFAKRALMATISAFLSWLLAAVALAAATAEFMSVTVVRVCVNVTGTAAIMIISDFCSGRLRLRLQLSHFSFVFAIVLETAEASNTSNAFFVVNFLKAAAAAPVTSSCRPPTRQKIAPCTTIGVLEWLHQYCRQCQKSTSQTFPQPLPKSTKPLKYLSHTYTRTRICPIPDGSGCAGSQY